MISASLPGMSLETPFHGSDKQNTVPCRLIYGLNWPMLKSMYKSSKPTMDDTIHEVLMGAPRLEQAIGSLTKGRKRDGW